MKKFVRSKKGVVALLAAVAVAISAIGAYAYFTSTGTGSGSATVGSATSWTVAGGAVVGTLYPGLDYGTADQGVVTGASVTNASASAYQKLQTIDATISAVTSPGPGGGPACAVTDFQFNSPGASWTGSGTQAAQINPGLDQAPGAIYNITDLNVAMVDNNANQDKCQGATVTVTLDAS